MSKKKRAQNKARRNRTLQRVPPPNISPSLRSPQTQGGSIQVTQATAFSGPIPPPDLLQHYNEVIPDGANRIVTMAENQSAHRIELEKKVIFGDSKRANWGLFCGYSLSLVVLALSFILVWNGHDTAGTVLGTTDLVSLVSVFVYGTHVRRQERARREDQNRALTRRR